MESCISTMNLRFCVYKTLHFTSNIFTILHYEDIQTTLALQPGYSQQKRCSWSSSTDSGGWVSSHPCVHCRPLSPAHRTPARPGPLHHACPGGRRQLEHLQPLPNKGIRHISLTHTPWQPGRTHSHTREVSGLPVRRGGECEG